MNTNDTICNHKVYNGNPKNCGLCERDQLRAEVERLTAVLSGCVCKATGIQLNQTWYWKAKETERNLQDAELQIHCGETDPNVCANFHCKWHLEKQRDYYKKASEDANSSISDLVDLLNKHTDAMDDARGVIQERYRHDPDGYGKAGRFIDAAFETLCPQCHHGTWSQEGGICTAMCRPDPGETEYWKCNCSRDYHRS